MTEAAFGAILEDFLPRIPVAVAEFEKVALPRERDQVLRSVANAGQFLGKARQLKSVAVSLGRELDANTLAANEFLLMSSLGELWMYLALKDHLYWDAHDCLVEALQDLYTARRFLNYPWIETRLHRLEKAYEVIFGTMVYMSPGITYESLICSICHGPYSGCDHVKGRLYMGELCGTKPIGVVLSEVSIVETPEDRRCLIREFDFEGRRIDRLTYKDLGPSSKQDQAMRVSGLFLATGRASRRLAAREDARTKRLDKLAQKRKRRK